MKDDELKRIQDQKREMVSRFLKLRTELNKFSREDLLSIRTSQLGEFGKLLKECVEYGKQLKP